MQRVDESNKWCKRLVMNKIKMFAYLFMSIVLFFLLGTYSESEKEVELYKWILSSFYSIFFLVQFFFEQKKMFIRIHKERYLKYYFK